MIREFVCIALLSEGLELERLKYTRIGFPRYDLDKLYNSKYSWETKHSMILKHIDKEFGDVNILIKKNDI